MSRRAPRPSSRRTSPSGTPTEARSIRPTPDDEPSTERYAEWLRRAALGLLAALIASRFCWPSEPDASTGAGAGLLWVLMLLVAAVLAIASAVVGGRLSFRWAWTDLAIVALMALVYASARRGLDQRVALNLGWEWLGLGLAYLLVRNLPRGRAESRALVGALVATAVAVSAYGLYQSRVEMPLLRARFERNPAQVLMEARVGNDPQKVQAFRSRLIDSTEVYSTFILANSLAGFLVGPTVVLIAVLLDSLVDPRSPGARWSRAGLIAGPLLCILICLILTKSFSAMAGLLAALAVLAWRAARRIPARRLVPAIAGIALLLGGLVAAGLATGRLDTLLITQARRSLGYRWEYWQGAWGVIGEGAATVPQAVRSATFWEGVGPGNFGGHYLKYKLPQASEEIQDPHNLFLEVWSTAGLWALLALAVALGLALWNLLGVARADRVPRETLTDHHSLNQESAVRRAGWLWVSSGLGLLLVMVVGEMNLFQDDLLARWLVLVVSWVAAAFLLTRTWGDAPLEGPALGAAVLAVAVNLLAQGGIGFAGVALALWTMAGLGLNLRENRASGRLREIDGYIPGFVLALGWSALLGTFFGQIVPYWRSQAAIARADDALGRIAPDFERAGAAYRAAIQADPLNVQPFLGEAYLQSLAWESRGSKPTDERWRLILAALKLAASPPRNPDSWTLHSERAKVTRDILAKVGSSLPPNKVIPLQAGIVEATRTASHLYPTNAMLHARLAEASAELSMFQDAVSEAQEALRLDELTPHQDKKLPGPVRDRLKARMPEWSEKASGR